MTAEQRTTTNCAGPVIGGTRAPAAGGDWRQSIHLAVAEEAQLQHRERQNQQEEHPGHRRRVPALVILEADLIQVGDQRLGVEDRPATVIT